METDNIGPRKVSRPRFSVSESESCLSNETQYTFLENGNGPVHFSPSASSGFFIQRSSSSASGGEHTQHLQQCENVIKSHHKLKVYFTVLFVVNVILIIIVIILIMFCVFFLMMARDAEGKSKTGGEVEMADYVRKDCPIKCKELKEHGFILDKDKECCSFDDVVSQMKTYTDQELRRTLPGRGRPRTSALTATSGKPAIHLVEGKPAPESSRNPHFIVGWISYIKNVFTFDKNQARDVITVPEKGLYFTYSRIHFTVKQKGDNKRTGVYQMPVTHALYRRTTGGRFEVIQDSSLKCSMQNDTSVVHSSYLEGIAYFKKGDEIKIGLTYSETLEYDITNKDNYFGMFQV